MKFINNRTTQISVWIMSYEDATDTTGTQITYSSIQSGETLEVHSDEKYVVFRAYKDGSNALDTLTPFINGVYTEGMADHTIAKNNPTIVADDVIIEFNGNSAVASNSMRWGLLIVEATPTTIIYNGNEIASLETGQTATLSCAEKKMLGDIVIAFGSDGAITYNGTVTNISAGQTATLTCSGKVAKTDIVITV